MTATKKGIWISVDGTDGVGKTTLAKYLTSTIPGTVLTPEFSDSVIGKYLREAVTISPYFISPSLVEQSLLFLAEFFRIHDTIVQQALQNDLTVITDRGYASKYVYQYLVLVSAFDSEIVRAFLDSLFKFIRPPDFTLYLTCDENLQVKRLLERDSHCDETRMQFIRQAEREFEIFLTSHNMHSAHLHQTDRMSLEEFLRDAKGIVGDYIEQNNSMKQ